MNKYRETEKKDGTRMRYDFLKHFPKRMKHVGLYAVLLQGSLQKTTWQKYGFVRADEQINLIFAVLLYIMEQSLKDEYCTKDDIGVVFFLMYIEYFKNFISDLRCSTHKIFKISTLISLLVL